MNRGPAEIFDCERVSSYLESYLLDQVPPPERRGMRLHIHRCPECFRKVTERDPLQLFAPLAEEEKSPESWDGFWSGIAEGIASAPAPGTSKGWFEGLRAAFTLPRFAMAAAGALVLYGAIVIGMKTSTPVSDPAGTESPVVAPPPVVAAVVETVPLPQTVEQVLSTHPVQVYSMAYQPAATTPGDPEDQALPVVTELVLIVDAELEL